MKQKLKRTNSNKTICSKNNNEYVGAGLVPAHNKGITLVALIITIIILLILAVVAISAVTGNGIIAHAKNARDLYGAKSEEENALLQDYLGQINKEINGGSLNDGDKEIDGTTVKGSLNTIISTTVNTALTDEYGNKITVPAGFKILVDSTTSYTADTIDVTKGIVLEDGDGNQFVWIPVGKIYTNTEKTESKTITLGRYSSFSKTNGMYTVAQNASNNENEEIVISPSFTEATIANLGNSIAKNIGEFCTKSLASGGYYIGRYEARTGIERKSETDTLTSVTLKANDYVYNYVTQPQASERCQNMYTNKPYESDLVNSYAWDTAIIFLQEFGDDSTYASKKSTNSSLANTGTSGAIYTGTKDVICNVYDMASNCREWSTETYGAGGGPCTIRGDYYDEDYGSYASSRGCENTIYALDYYSFRPILYM